MRLVTAALLALMLVAGCSSDDELERVAAESLQACMQSSGIPVQDVTFEIERRRLMDWNVAYPEQGQPHTDNVHNACIRQIVDDLDLNAQLP